MNIPLKEKHPLIILVAFVGLALLSLIAIMLVGFVIGVVVWGPDFSQTILNPVPAGQYVLYMKYLQILSHLGMFIVPALIVGRLAGKGILQYFSLNKGAGIMLLLLGAVAMIALQPLINWLTIWNSGLTLPDSMRSTEEWMKESEAQAAAMTEMFLTTTSTRGLILNLFMMAVLPAIGEELVFRGILQKQLHRWFRSAWAAVLVSSVVFSAIHLQFYGFLPRLVLGALLGYAFMVTGKLWVPILMHFINNGMAVLVYWLYQIGAMGTAPEQFANFNDNIVLMAGSVVLFAVVLYIFDRTARARLVQQSNE